MSAEKTLNIVEVAVSPEASSAEDTKLADEASEDAHAKKKDRGPKLPAVLAKQALGVARDSVYRWIVSRGLPAHKVGRISKLKLSQVDAWVEAGGAKAEDAGGGRDE